MILYVAVLLLGVVTYFIYKIHRKQKLSFPGPQGWPLVGNAFQVKNPSRPEFTFTEWGKKHGGVFQFNVLQHPLLVCCSYEAIYEVLVVKSREFASRPTAFRISSFFAEDIATQHYSETQVALKKSVTSAMKFYHPGWNFFFTITLFQNLRTKW